MQKVRVWEVDNENRIEDSSLGSKIWRHIIYHRSGILRDFRENQLLAGNKVKPGTVITLSQSVSFPRYTQSFWGSLHPAMRDPFSIAESVFPLGNNVSRGGKVTLFSVCCVACGLRYKLDEKTWLQYNSLYWYTMATFEWSDLWLVG